MREMFQNMTVSSLGGEQRRGQPLKDDGNGGEFETRARLVMDAAHTTQAAILVGVCGVTERPGRAPFAFVCSSFVSNKQNKEATKRLNQPTE